MDVVFLACCSHESLAGHSHTHEFIASDKTTVVVTAFVQPLVDSTKAVKMDLTLEGPVLCLLEISWHDCLGKYAWLVDTKGLSVGLPRNNILRFTVGHIFKHVVELDRKRELC